jgi:hypothetical protein
MLGFKIKWWWHKTVKIRKSINERENQDNENVQQTQPLSLLV